MIEVDKYIEAQMLVQALNQHQSTIEQNTNLLTNIKNAITQKRKKQLNMIYWSSVIAICIFNIIYVFLFRQDFVYFMIGDDESLISQIGFIYIFVVIPTIFILLLAYGLIVKNIFNHREKNRALTLEEQQTYTACRESIERSLSAVEGIKEQLQLSPIPQKYLNVSILGWMIEAIDNQRADTPKELYNLYEQYVSDERRHQEQMDAISNINVHN